MHRDNRLVVAVSAGVLATVLVAVGVFGLRVAGRPASGSGDVRMAPATPLPPPPVSPYDGTPAAGFASGVAGIVLPRAERVPDGHLADYQLNTRAITAEEVAETLELVRQSLIAARLGYPMLVEHDPEPYLRTLSPGYWEVWSRPSDPLWEHSHDWFESPASANRLTRLAPGASLSAIPRMDGQITYRNATTFDGTSATETQPWRILEVVTRFVWVYALDTAEPGEGIVVVRDEAVWYVPADYRLFCCESNLGVHPGEAEARAWGADCEAYAEGLVRPGRPGEIAEVTDAAFDLDQPLASTVGCRPSG